MTSGKKSTKSGSAGSKTGPKTQSEQKTEKDPEIASYRGRRLWYVVGFGCALAVLAATTFITSERPLAGWEESLFLSINNWPDNWRYVALSVTALGSSWMAVASVGMTFLLKMYWLAWRLAFSILAGYAAVLGMKTWIGRARPEELVEATHLRAAESLAGFPSGHSMLITVVMFTLLPYLPRFWRWVLAIAMVVVVVLSRIYLGVHFPLDVVGGVALGVLVVCFIRVLPYKIRSSLKLG